MRSKTQTGTGWQNTVFGWRKAIIYSVPSGKVAVQISIGNQGNELKGWSVSRPRYYTTYGGILNHLGDHGLSQFADTDAIKKQFFPHLMRHPNHTPTTSAPSTLTSRTSSA